MLRQRRRQVVCPIKQINTELKDARGPWLYSTTIQRCERDEGHKKVEIIRLMVDRKMRGKSVISACPRQNNDRDMLFVQISQFNQMLHSCC